MRIINTRRRQRRHTTVIVACSGAKSELATFAADLYQGDLYRKARSYAEAHGDNWFILSAEHGLVNPMDWVEPYNKTIHQADHGHLVGKLVQQLYRMEKEIEHRVVLLLPAPYAKLFEEARTRVPKLRNVIVKRPLKGLGIGQQKAWLMKSENLFTGQIGLDLGGPVATPEKKVQKVLGWNFNAARAILARAWAKTYGHDSVRYNNLAEAIACPKARALAKAPRRKLYALLRRQRPASWAELMGQGLI